MDELTLRQYETLSPFEIKNDLATIGSKSARAAQIAYLNAGRGNPNWIALEPRAAFFLLGQFALTESRRTLDLPAGIGGMPAAPGIAARLIAWLNTQATAPGASFLQDVRWELDRLSAAGIARVIVVDLTRPELQVPVVRAIIPGLEGTHLNPAYAPGRRGLALLNALEPGSDMRPGPGRST